MEAEFNSLEAKVAQFVSLCERLRAENVELKRELAAAARGQLYAIPADLIQRQTPRILDGAERLCGRLEGVRARS